jgi:hypothetical protein
MLYIVSLRLDENVNSMNSDQPVAPDSTLKNSPDNYNTEETSVKDMTPLSTDTSVENTSLPYYTLLLAIGILIIAVSLFVLRKINKK